MRLADRVAIVTGTSPNIGGGIAEELAREGARVACLDSNESNAVDCAAAIQRAGGKAIAIPTDVTDSDAVDAAVEQAANELGGVHILVNNAVFFNQKGLLDMPLDQWRSQLDVILTGAFLCTRAAARIMIARKLQGSIVNVVSTAGHQGQPGNLAYCTGKSGLLNFTRAAAMDLAPYRIRVNSMTPTATDPSDGMDRAERWGRPRPPEVLIGLFDGFRRSVPLQSLPTPQDYGRAVTFLASDDAQHMTGADLRIDSGAVGRYWAWDPAREETQ